MAKGAVDRAKWAAVVRRLMNKHAHGRKATFAKIVGYDPRTVTDWLGEVYSVREATIRQVAEKTGLSAIDLLVEVGVFSTEDLPSYRVPAEDQWIVDVIRASALHIEAQDMLIADELERARREREEVRRRIEEQIELVRVADGGRQ